MRNISLEAVLLEALDDERKAEATYRAVIKKFAIMGGAEQTPLQNSKQS